MSEQHENAQWSWRTGRPTWIGVRHAPHDAQLRAEAAERRARALEDRDGSAN